KHRRPFDYQFLVLNPDFKNGLKKPFFLYILNPIVCSPVISPRRVTMVIQVPVRLQTNDDVRLHGISGLLESTPGDEGWEVNLILRLGDQSFTRRLVPNLPDAPASSKVIWLRYMLTNQ